METSVVGRHLEITEPINAYAVEKTTKIGRLSDQLSKIEVVASKKDNHTFDIELIAHVDGHDHFVSHGKHEDLYACIDEACAKMERQISDHKAKLVDHHRG